MPGLVGYVKRNTDSGAGLKLAALAEALESASRFKRHLYEGDGFGLGRVSLEVLNPQPQPIWNADHSRCVVMEGEFYDQRPLRQLLEQQGVRFQGESDAELALYLYEAYGEDFAARLNGLFAIAIWDGVEQKMLVVNDRLSNQPIYYALTGSGLLFASGVRALLVDPALSRQTDRLAIAQFMVFDHVLDDRTFLAGARLLPQASVLTYRLGVEAGEALRIHPYWTLKYAETYPLRSEADYVDELKHLIQQAVARQAGSGMPLGILLSGGLDSRVILGELAAIIPRDHLHTFTWGIPGCDDCRAAGELARVSRTQHHFFELKPDWLLQFAEEAVRITDGLGNVTNLHALAAAKEESQLASVVYKGFMGDAMMGYALMKRFWGDYDEETWFKAHLQTHTEHGVIAFQAEEQEQLFSAELQNEIGDGVFESYRAGMKRAGSHQLAVQRLYFDMTQRVPRMTLNGVEVMRSYAPVRLPFCDNDLYEFTTRVPPGYLFERRLSARAFVEAHPALAKVPIAGDGLPMMACTREIQARLWKLAQWHLRNHGLSRLAGPYARPYKDYNLWFRTLLRPWVEGTLLSPAALERGYFNPDYLRKLVSEHMAGANHAVRLGALLSVELWHRQFID
jgi:asparagine synthase (glutamine-hydrolysing)